MRSENIIDLINHTTTFSEQSLSELEALLTEYPYFQAARMLYLLNLQALKDTQLPASLKKTACYLSDRSKLFFLLEEDFFTPVRIQSLSASEQEEITPSGFDLIDFFLKDKPEKTVLPQKKEKEVATTDYLSYLMTEEMPEETVKPMQHQDLIDRFLSEDEKGSIQIELKDEESSEIPASIMDLETVDDSSFFSETLAKIYIKQKKYEKALLIIKELYLLNPEKNRYFADQIRFLEKLITNTQKK